MKKRLLFLLIFLPALLQAQFNNFGYGLVINAQLVGSTLQLSVNDPSLGIITNQMSNINNYIIEDGCVIGTNGSSVAYGTYDTEDHQWKTGATSTSSGTVIHNKDGVVGWATTGGSVYFGTYDPIIKLWSFYGGSTGSSPTLKLNQGIAAYSTPGGSVSFGIYEYSQHAWITYGGSTGVNPSVTVSEGIVAYSTPGGSVYYAIYNHLSKQWDTNGGSTGVSPTIVNQDGIVAYSTPGGSVYYAVFDPLLNQWITEGGSTGNNPVLSINDGTVYYTVGSTNYIYGYDINLGGWVNNSTTVIYCKPFIETPDPNHTDFCVFRVESIGANAYSYSCDDGQFILQRNAIKRYTSAGTYNPTLQVSNSSYNSTCGNPVNIGTGINDVDNIKFEISPNPSSAIIKIKSPLKMSSIQLINIEGRPLISEKKIDTTESEINIEKYPSGVYLIKINVDGETYNHKIIKL
jgi:hypothetical protein